MINALEHSSREVFIKVEPSVKVWKFQIKVIRLWGRKI